jgi:hypothetical protein
VVRTYPTMPVRPSPSRAPGNRREESLQDMALKTIKARAAQAAELLESLKKKARLRRESCSSPVLVVYGQDEAARIYFEGEDGVTRRRRH